MQDAEIVALYWQRSDRAIPESARKYGRYCHTIAYNICANTEDAEECVNDTWLGAWNSMPQNRPRLLAPYLAKLTRWLSLTRLRERNALRRGGGETALVLDELSEVIPDGTDLEKRVELKELSAALKRFLYGLDETEAQVFLARCWYLAPVKEIAAKYGFTPGKVSTTLHRTRGKLQAYLREEGLC